MGGVPICSRYLKDKFGKIKVNESNSELDRLFLVYVYQSLSSSSLIPAQWVQEENVHGSTVVNYMWAQGHMFAITTYKPVSRRKKLCALYLITIPQRDLWCQVEYTGNFRPWNMQQFILTGIDIWLR